MKKKARTTQEQLEWLVTNTTVLWVERYNTQEVVAGEKSEMDRFSQDQGDPVSFSDVLEPLWQRKFASYGNYWNRERQNYRLMYHAMNAFFTSFTALRKYKVLSLESRDNWGKKMMYGNLAELLLAQMYMSGKKALDLMTEELQLLSSAGFVSKFCETRNKLFEHNYKPDKLENLILDPFTWQVIASKSQMTVFVHVLADGAAVEREYEAVVDYYQDYYELEKIFVDVVQKFT